LFNVYITKILLHNLSKRHVSALSSAIVRLSTLLCEVKHTIKNIILLLLTRSRVTSIKCINLKLIAAIVEIKHYYNIKYIKEQGVTITKGEWGCQNRGNFKMAHERAETFPWDKFCNNILEI